MALVMDSTRKLGGEGADVRECCLSRKFGKRERSKHGKTKNHSKGRGRCSTATVKGVRKR